MRVPRRSSDDARLEWGCCVRDRLALAPAAKKSDRVTNPKGRPPFPACADFVNAASWPEGRACPGRPAALRPGKATGGGGRDQAARDHVALMQTGDVRPCRSLGKEDSLPVVHRDGGEFRGDRRGKA